MAEVLNENAENIPLQKIKLDAPPIHAFEREEITDVFETGIKSIDSMLTIGIGQKDWYFRWVWCWEIYFTRHDCEKCKSGYKRY